MSRGKRYNGEAKLNMKKVLAVVIALLVIVMFVSVIYKLVTNGRGERMTNNYYFTSFQDNKYGVINNKGQEVIAPSYQEYIVIPNNRTDIFLCTYDVDYSNNTYKTKALNSKNEEIFTDYENLEPIANYDSNNIISYEQNAIKVQKNGKYGMINIEGKEILPCEYDALYSLKNTNNSILVEKDGKIGLVDSTGKVIIEPQYKEIRGLGTDYTSGYIVITEDNQYGVVDCNNQKVLDTKYQDIKSLTDNGTYVVKENNNWELVQRNGEVTFSDGLKNVKDILGLKNGNVIIQNTNNKVGVINTTGETILNTVYDDIEFAFVDSYIIEQNGKYGIAKKNDEIVLNPTYTTINYIQTADIIEASEDGITSNLLNSNLETKLTGIVTEINTSRGYIRIRQDNENKYYNFRFEERPEKDINTSNTLFLDKQNDKYGYVDKDGKVVVDYQYDDATEQNEYGYAAVQKDGKWGAINEKGEEIVNPQYDFSNNINIDFIGEWHLGSVDSNATYYTK